MSSCSAGVLTELSQQSRQQQQRQPHPQPRSKLNIGGRGLGVWGGRGGVRLLKRTHIRSHRAWCCVCVCCREHSWRALFAGLRPAVGATAASQGIYFTCYSVLRQMAVVSPAYRGDTQHSNAGRSWRPPWCGVGCSPARNCHPRPSRPVQQRPSRAADKLRRQTALAQPAPAVAVCCGVL